MDVSSTQPASPLSPSDGDGIAGQVQAQSVGRKPINRRMIDLQSSFPHHFFEISIAERIAKIPANTEENEVRLEVTLFKGVQFGHDGPSWFCFSPTVSDQLTSCNTTHLHEASVCTQVSTARNTFRTRMSASSFSIC